MKTRKPLRDMSNHHKSSLSSSSSRPVRNKKPSIRLSVLKGEDNADVGQVIITRTNKQHAHAQAPPRKDNVSKKSVVISSTPLKTTRSRAKNNPEPKTSPIEAKAKTPVKSPPVVEVKPKRTLRKPAKLTSSPKPALVTNTEKNVSKKAPPTRKVTRTPSKRIQKTVPEIEKPQIPESTDVPVDKPTSDTPIGDKPVKIPIYQRIKALNTPSPVPPPEELYEFPVDLKAEPSKPAKKRNVVKKPKTTAPRKRNKKIELNQSEEMGKLIKELKKIRAATLAKKKKALLQNVPKIAITPAVIEPPPPPPVFADTSSSSTHKSNELNEMTIDSEGLGTSMFSDAPIANSSMIRPVAPSPWRVQCNDVNKWPKNFYVKPSMTPAYERDTSHTFGLDNANATSSVVEETTKAPIDPKDYTLYKEDASDWRQTSILSYYVTKSPKKRGRSPKKQTKIKEVRPVEEVDIVEEIPQEVSVPDLTPEEPEAEVSTPVVENFFGFNEDPEFDQENVSPKKIPKLKTIKEIVGRTRRQLGNVLKEVNQKASDAPARMSPKKILSVINANKKRVEEQMPANIFVRDECVEVNEENEVPDSSVAVAETSAEIRLFENPADADISLFNRAHRRSYERKKRPPVKFKDAIEIIAPVSNSEAESDSDAEPVKVVIKKKKKKPNTATKKEEKEANEWAAGFNSLLEEADEFALCVE